MKNNKEIGTIITAISAGVVAVSAATKAVNDIIQNTANWNWTVVIPILISMLAIITLVIFMKKYLNIKNNKDSADVVSVPKTKSEIICGWFDDYIANGEGKQYMKTIGSEDEQKFKIAQMHKAFETLKGKNSSGLLESKTYYLFIYALLHGAKTSVWAVSMGDEWVINSEEIEFVRMNFEVAKRKVEFERIFVISKEKVDMLISNKHVQEQINNNNKYFRTWIVFKEDIDEKDENLYRSLGCGFLAFDDFAVADDSFDDADVRGFVYTQHDDYQKYHLKFTQLRPYAKPFDKEFVEKWEFEKNIVTI